MHDVEGGAALDPVMSQAILDETVECVLDMFPEALPKRTTMTPPGSAGKEGAVAGEVWSPRHLLDRLNDPNRRS